ncbi:DUF1007 family protein [Sulfurospirillum oryzae]|uniref:DUF1007 family protein n=1 Tax=Sulfurospirillum oryzae TaxID=2976535 RepID=UPI0021E7D535|nr:DUF1007 family protein [Sulfurospirillum oryzae]
MVKLALYFILLISSAHACALCGSNKISFINASTNTIFSNNTIEKIEVVWKFEEAFSSQLISLYDQNRDTLFDPQETQTMFQLLSDVEKPPFMSMIQIDGIEIKTFKVSHFQATIKDKIVYFSFDIELNYPMNDSTKLLFYFFDSTRSLAFFHTAENIKYANTTRFDIHNTFGFKVLQNTMSVVNTISYEVQK